MIIVYANHLSYTYVAKFICKQIVPFMLVKSMLNKNTLGVKKVRGQSEAALQIGMYDQKR